MSMYPTGHLGKVYTKDHIESCVANGRFVCTGTIFEGSRSNHLRYRTVDVRVPCEGVFLAFIAITMLYPDGGSFDDDDVVFADIFSIDGQRLGITWHYPSQAAPGLPWDISRPIVGEGGAWGGLLGGMPPWPQVNEHNMVISSWVGSIQKYVRFRLAIDGDDIAAATFAVMQL